MESVQISSKNVDIAWIVFNSKETVRNIFKQAAIKQTRELNVFPVILECGLERKNNLEDILKSLHEMDSSIRYQIRGGYKSKFQLLLLL